MKLFLAGNTIFPKYVAPEIIGGGGFPDKILYEHRPFVLESFFYADKDTERLIPYFGDFMLDSGAFTFMENAKVRVEWEEYLERYADFVVRNDVKKFFELDIDSVVGYEKVLQYRDKLERMTNRQCIPVWHISRGYEEFKKICNSHKYVAIGGIVSGEWDKSKYAVMPKLIQEAHRQGAKIHGLGFTQLSLLPQLHFDSVDSTAWTTGNRFGFIYRFNGKAMEKKDVPKGKRLGDPRKVAIVNYTEWLKYQQWAETHL